jgi:hypothetical protein
MNKGFKSWGVVNNSQILVQLIAIQLITFELCFLWLYAFIEFIP